jgi:hypothetical protein
MIATGMWRPLVFVLLVHITLDFSDPNLPGAFNFDSNESVDAVYTQARKQLPIARTSLVRDWSVLNEVPLSTSVDGRPFRPVIGVERTSLLNVGPRALLSHAERPSSTEPH